MEWAPGGDIMAIRMDLRTGEWVSPGMVYPLEADKGIPKVSRSGGPGIFSLPLRDRCPLRVCSLSPSASGARYGYILSSLSRLVPAPGDGEQVACAVQRGLGSALLEGASAAGIRPGMQ
eukprot:1175795-Prorocentrum_minimum.AAC.1